MHGKYQSRFLQHLRLLCGIILSHLDSLLLCLCAIVNREETIIMGI